MSTSVVYRAQKKRFPNVLYGNAGGEQPEPIAPTLLTQLGSLVLMRPALYGFVLTQAELSAGPEDLYGGYQRYAINLNA